MIGYTTYRAAPSGKAGRPLAALIAGLDVAASWLIVFLLSGMVAIVVSQVVLRYVFNSSFGWADEASRLAFVWTMFLAIPLGVKAGVHIGMEIVVERLPAPWRDALARLMALIAMTMMLLVAWNSLWLAIDQWDELMASVNASAAWFIVPLVASGLHGALHLFWIALNGRPRKEVDDVATE